jgi:polyhydroxybutyrate depolymerase
MFMKLKILLIGFLISVSILTSYSAVVAQPAKVAPNKNTAEPQVMEWNIEGVVRKALVYIPAGAKTKNTPIVFAFHGHGGLVENGPGGTMGNMYKTRRFDQLWPEAIFICPQGLNTPGQLTDKEGKFPGWQKSPGDMNDRDLKFFDAMLAKLLKDYKIDKSRIFSTGHSNGGGFTYLLLATRGDTFAAMAPTGSAASRLMTKLKPKPVLHLYGEKDDLVKAEWQIATCKYLLKMNACDTSASKPFAKDATIYLSKSGNPVVVYRYPGGHGYPKVANGVIIDFFKRGYKL